MLALESPLKERNEFNKKMHLKEIQSKIQRFNGLPFPFQIPICDNIYELAGKLRCILDCGLWMFGFLGDGNLVYIHYDYAEINLSMSSKSQHSSS
jgi:hypothetical protein